MPQKMRYLAITIFSFLSLFITTSLFIVPKVVTAATCDPTKANINLADCYALNDTQTVASVYNNPTVLINLLVRNLFVLAGILFFFLLIYGGFLFITGDVKGKDKALEIFKTAGIGFAVMFSAYWILQIVQVVTGTNILF
jgi:hypothetical protein